MGQWDDNQKEDSGLTEMEQMQLDAVLLETAYENSFLVLTNQITFEDLLVKKFKHGHEAVLAFDPDEGPELTEFENMIAFYIETEEYERCAKIRDIMLNSYPQSVND
tara:strand:+ start:2187 stop:2507 length:321 start_codon:yes stop_codon:yes gene_type:complete